MDNIEIADPIDQAITWEFQLWKQAEQARFRAELKKLEMQRNNAIRSQFTQQERDLSGQKSQKLGQLEQLSANVTDAIVAAQQKYQDLKTVQEQVKLQQTQVKQRLQQQLLQAENQVKEQLADAELILNTELARAEQSAAQAAFFQNEWQSCEKRRELEQKQFSEFMVQQQKGQAGALKQKIVKYGADQMSLHETVTDLESECCGLEGQLEEIMSKISRLQQLV